MPSSGQKKAPCTAMQETTAGLLSVRAPAASATVRTQEYNASLFLEHEVRCKQSQAMGLKRKVEAGHACMTICHAAVFELYPEGSCGPLAGFKNGGGMVNILSLKDHCSHHREHDSGWEKTSQGTQCGEENG